MSQQINAAVDAELNMLIANKQRWLAGEYDWPFLRRYWDVTVPSGQRLTSFPTLSNGTSVAIDFDRPHTVEVYIDNVWHPVEVGIGAAEYNTYDYETRGETNDYITRYAWADNGQFEVWPVPATAQTVRFWGQRVLELAAADTDTIELDDLLIVLSCAAERLARVKAADAVAKAQLASRRLQVVRAIYQTREREIVLGSMFDNDKVSKKPLQVVVAGGGQGGDTMRVYSGTEDPPTLTPRASFAVYIVTTNGKLWHWYGGAWH